MVLLEFAPLMSSVGGRPTENRLIRNFYRGHVSVEASHAEINSEDILLVNFYSNIGWQTY